MLPTGATTRIGTSLTSAGLLLGGTAVVVETGSNEDMNIWRISGTHIPNTREVDFWCSLFGGFSDFVHYFKKECYICYEISFEIVRHLLNLYKVSVPRCFEIFEKNKNAKIEIFVQSLQIE